MNVPKLRFKEFNDELNTFKIKDTGNVITGMTPSTADKKNYGSEYLWVSPGDMGYSKYIANTKTKLSLKGFNKTRQLPNNSILVTCIGSTIGKMGMSNSTLSTNQQINSIIPTKNFNPNYLYYCINYNFPKFLNKISFQAVPIISKSEFEKLEIKCTLNLSEQEKIGNMLDLLDKKIELQFKKIEDLKLFKVRTLDRYFNKNINETRSLLKNYCFCLTGKSKVDKVDMNGKYYIMDMGTVNADGNILKIKPTFCNSDLLSYGDLVMPKDDIGGGLIIGKTGFIDEDNKYILGDHVYLLKTKDINSLFLHYQINSRYINRQLKRKVTGSAQLGLKSDNILNQEIFVYSDNNQEIIANIFKLMDKKIELECNELNKLLEYKKGLMQNMFV